MVVRVMPAPEAGAVSRRWFARSRAARPQRRVALALQGGGSHGAFTWGVLTRLIEDDTLAFDAVCGTSAGAVNAVLMADGLCRGGRAEAAARLERFWHRLSTMAGPVPFGAWSAAAAAMGFSARQASPYRLNPLGIDPLREMLAAEIDFARLRAASPLRLLIAATNVRTGQVRLFREHEITVDAVLASACLPFLHHAVEINGEAYWDGAYSANPPLMALIALCDADDIVLVRLTPENVDAVPRRPQDIAQRLDQIVFNAPLHREIETVAELHRTTRARLLPSRLGRRLRRLRLHTIAAADSAAELLQTSAFEVDRTFLTRLKDAGVAAAETCLAQMR